jgi:hypothetical protein
MEETMDVAVAAAQVVLEIVLEVLEVGNGNLFLNYYNGDLFHAILILVLKLVLVLEKNCSYSYCILSL